jgi:hypothetical protein
LLIRAEAAAIWAQRQPGVALVLDEPGALLLDVDGLVLGIVHGIVLLFLRWDMARGGTSTSPPRAASFVASDQPQAVEDAGFSLSVGIDVRDLRPSAPRPSGRGGAPAG